MNLQGGSHHISQVDGLSDMTPAYRLLGGGLSKGTTASAHLDATGSLQAATPALEFRGSE